MDNYRIVYVNINELKPAEYNPRRAGEKEVKQLTESIKRFGLVDPIIVNSDKSRANIIIGGHFRWNIAKQLGIKTVPVIYISISDITKERELNLRLNKNTGDWDWDLLANFDEELLKDVGFDNLDFDINEKEKEVDENLETKNVCPKCGYKW